MPCASHFAFGELARLLVEDVDEQTADDLALGFRIADAFERVEVARRRHRRGCTLTPMCSANVAITWSPSFQRSRPVSTNTQVSWSPIALCSSAATTEESTPPDRPSITSSVPTCARTRAIWSSMMFAAVHSVRAAADVDDEAAQQRLALLRVRDFGMELHAVPAARLVGHRGDRDASVRAVTVKPGGASATWSPWLIHTSRRGGEPGWSFRPSSSASCGDELDLGVAELARVGGLGLAAELRGHGLHAVADAEHRQARVEHLLRRAAARRLRSSIPGRRTG